MSIQSESVTNLAEYIERRNWQSYQDGIFSARKIDADKEADYGFVKEKKIANIKDPFFGEAKPVMNTQTAKRLVADVFEKKRLEAIRALSATEDGQACFEILGANLPFDVKDPKDLSDYFAKERAAQFFRGICEEDLRVKLNNAFTLYAFHHKEGTPLQSDIFSLIIEEDKKRKNRCDEALKKLSETDAGKACFDELQAIDRVEQVAILEMTSPREPVDNSVPKHDEKYDPPKFIKYNY